MYRVLECLTQDHNYWLVATAALVCVIGSCLSVLMSRRLVTATGARKQVQLVLTSLIAGSTIWSTHFIAMLAYEPGFEHGYAPLVTAASLGVAVLGLIVANSILAYTSRWYFAMLSGSLFGVTVSAMHYLGMSAYLLPGHLVWNTGPVSVSVLLGAALGAFAYHRIAFPVTRYCWMGGALLMVLAICAMHFTGMSAFTIEFSPLVDVPPQVLADNTLSILVLGITFVILLIGFASFSIETDLEHQARDQLHRAALQDPLTGLPNRMHLTQKMTELTAKLERTETERVAVLTIDLNLFKEVNDLYGHATGDAVLKTVAARLSADLEQHEFIARAGGDEFVALKSGFRRVDQVMAFAERLHAVVIEPIVVGEISTTVGAAIGIATSIDDGRDLRELLHKSDLAMYRAKSEPERHVCLFNVEMDQQSREKLVLINDLRQACGNGEFELVYQIQNDLQTLDPVGFEVLLRWNHPTRGRVSPGEFIPIAEETGLIREIGLWVLRTACFEATSWPEPFSIAVNVAPQQLVQPSFLEHVSDILMETRLPPERLELEVTEASIIDDQAHTLRVMHKLKKMGIRIAMDDFGTGYSSLATLQTFPFDKIKIDRSFVQDVHKDQQRAAIVRSTLLLGAALNIPVLAEGVEMEDELTFLRAENCSAVQGFYFGKPMRRDQLHEVFAKPDRKTGT
ncbi:bifunctional diguanylate cyclase/phosphodiesterase [Roseobacter sp. YSTF-M11]|uniref:Bifunctional diguanylate cyclase/phosphodiesterase n=1 Tax=Roseobacter insulae TaxID=2859783 RepID=A0A9X1K5C2_9RHOB|nr:bifunctional diguanylate cyclase/phosphodiesterase [Roseobacter insulae]MBW4710667.1 bifunctional diguanylate cyclase/phosphodiesterase [Roseobacter insulae]